MVMCKGRKELEDTVKKTTHMQMQGKTRRACMTKRYQTVPHLKECTRTVDFAQHRSAWHMKTQSGPLLDIANVYRPLGEEFPNESATRSGE